jgi:hypothetical protein
MRQRLRRLGLSLGVEFTRVRRRSDGSVGYSYMDEHIERLINDLDIGGRFCVDIASADGKQGSNTFPMFRDGWSGLAVEADAVMFERLAINYSQLPGATLHRGFATPINVVSLLAASGAPRDFAFLSLDIDSYDHYVLEAILSAYRPRLMCVEHNEIIPPPVSFAKSYSADISGGGKCYGQSLSALNALASQHDYVLLEVWYNNALFAPAECGREAADVRVAYKRGYLDRPDRLQRMHWNQPFEVLQSMTPEQVVAFLDSHPDFAANRGGYILAPC